jgi:hypothetical protein
MCSRWDSGGPCGLRAVARLLLLVLAAAMVEPRSLVWCRANDGHDAVENAWLGCCVSTGPGETCSPDRGRGASTPGAAPLSCTGESCTDVLLAPAVVLSPSPRPVAPPPVAALPFVILAGRSDSARTGARRVVPASSRQVRDLLRATVLTI